MVAYTLPQPRKKEESERLRGERDQIELIDLGFGKTFHKLHVLGMNGDLWDRVRGD